MNKNAAQEYRKLEERLRSLILTNNDGDEAELIRTEMDDLWWDLTPEERKEGNLRCREFWDQHKDLL